MHRFSLPFGPQFVTWQWEPTGQSAVAVQTGSEQVGKFSVQCFAPSVLASHLEQFEYWPGQSLLLISSPYRSVQDSFPVRCCSARYR
jgi:hypothetical protein